MHLHGGEGFIANELGDLVRPVADKGGRADYQRGLVRQTISLLLHMACCTNVHIYTCHDLNV